MTAKWKSLNLGQVSKWDNIQSDRFTLWANHLLQKKGLAIKDLADFADGVLLLNLLEVVSGKTVPRFIKNPRFLQQKIENITIALSFIEKVLDIKVLGCNAKDIADGNLKQKSKESGGDEIAVDAKGKEGLPKSASNSSVNNNYTTGANNNNTNNHVEPEPSITAIPITQETAPFTPKVHRPRSYIATLDMLGARPSPKNSFLAKQEFFEKKDQEVRDTRPQTTKAPLVSPTSKEIGVPIMLISARKSDTDESPRSDVTSDVGTITPRSDVSITPRDTPISPRDTPISPRDTPISPRDTPISPRDTPISPRETLVSPRREAPVTPRGEPTDQEVVSSPRSESAEKEEKKLEEKQTPPSTPRAPEVETKPATPRAAETEKEPKLASAPSTPRAAESEQKQEQEPEKVVVQTPEATPETTTVPEPTTPEPTQPEKTPEPTSEPTPETAPETPKQTPATPETENEVPTLTPVTSVEGQPEEKPTEKSEEKPEEQLTPEQIKRADKLKKKESKREKSRRMSEIKKKKEKRRSGTEGELIEGQEEDVKKDIEVKKEEEKPTEEVEEDVSIPEDVAIVLQTHIRGILERLNYDRVLKDIAKRKSDLLASISGNAKALRGTLRVQATFRGRLTRIRVRREAQIYRRNEIAKEILTTERKYVQNLDILVEQFLVPLKAMLLPQQVRNIFSNVEVIRGYNKTILTRLEDRMKVWYSKGQCLGDIFVERSYVNNYNTSIATMTECMENTKFSAFIEKMRVAPECNGLSFASFLIQPIQRLPRYVLLLQDLLKHTTNTHADYAKLSVALKKMKDVADYVNERKREAENLTQVLAIQSKLTGKFENLAEPHRRYVRRGSLAMFDEKGNIRSFFFFLFNDILVYTENKGQNRLFRGSFGRHIPPNWDEQAFNSGKFKFVGRLPLLGLGAGVADVPDTEKDKVSFAFQLITPTTSTLLMANSQDEKVAWMNDLDECVYALLEKERSRKISQLTEDPQSSWHTKVTANTDLEEGDYTGYIYKKANNNSWKQRYFMLRNGMLYYFNEKPPAEVKEVPARVISLVWCSVKVGQVLGRGAVFQLATPARIIFLSSPDLRTMFHYVLRLAIAGQIQALGEDEEVASITENRVNGLAEPPMGDKFEPILELPNSPPLHSHSLSPSPSLSSSPTLASSPTTSVPSFNAHASTSMQDLKDLMNDPANRVCADCGAPGPSWVSTSWGVLLCVACSGIHRRLPSGASGLHSVRSIANRPESVELRSLSNAMANARYEKNVPPEMNKPSQADSYDKKVEWIKAKYSSTDGLEALPTSPPLSRSSSASSSARSTPDSLTHSVSSPVLTLGGSPRKEGSLRDLKDKNKPGERRNSALGLDKALNKTKEGLLYKRQGALLQDDWKLYRFVLKEDHISYFKNKQPKGTIDLMLCSVKEGEVFASGTDRPKYSFELVAPTRIYMLAAESPQARDEWVHAINVCIATMMK